MVLACCQKAYGEPMVFKELMGNHCFSKNSWGTVVLQEIMEESLFFKKSAAHRLTRTHSFARTHARTKQIRFPTTKSQWNHNGLTLKSQWNHHEITMESQWHHNGITIKSQWDHNGITIKSQWNHNEITMESQWDHNEITKESQWHHNGITIESLLNHNGITMKSQWNHNEITNRFTNPCLLAYSSLEGLLGDTLDEGGRVATTPSRWNHKCLPQPPSVLVLGAHMGR